MVLLVAAMNVTLDVAPGLEALLSLSLPVMVAGQSSQTQTVVTKLSKAKRVQNQGDVDGTTAIFHVQSVGSSGAEGVFQ